MTAVSSIDVRTGTPVAEVAAESTAADVDAVCVRAERAFPALEALGRAGRAAMLRAMADELEARRATLTEVADRESALGETRLNGELTRTCFQLRLFAEVIEDGGYLEATIDHAGDTAMGPRPDVRRMLVPLGPVGVFGASNFPFAFSVPGGDTASALATGCPVVVKAHPAHPGTSQLAYEALDAGARASGAPEGTVGIVHGQEGGSLLVRHPAIKAVGFTGSLRGGRALFDLASARPDPIPFYGELGSLNPLVVTPAAAAERAEEIAKGLIGSFTLGVGQFCTKPGLAFVPAGEAAERLRAAMTAGVAELGAGWMLSAGIHDAFEAGAARLRETAGVSAVASTPDGNGSQGPTASSPVVFAARAGELSGAVLEECFGPVTVLAEYADEEELFAALAGLSGALTATVHIGDGETGLPERLAAALRDRAGRLIWNGFPTGVAVAWAMNHGGPWPATTNALHTSVGGTAVRRFVRPVAWQDAPQSVLPEELRDGPVSVPRRVDGTLEPSA
ncbi:MAG: aldehyde dehydrogenase family protein [Streptosporangiales bacterium]|nr:aldehyde dehydrogenase family protein [Streptosporangiales bacterium]